METVFVVIRMLSNDGTENHSIFSSYKLAEEFINEAKEYETDELQIVEVELNQEVLF